MEPLVKWKRTVTDFQQLGKALAGVLLSVGAIQLAGAEATTLPVAGELSGGLVGALGLVAVVSGFALLQALNARGSAGCGCTGAADSGTCDCADSADCGC